MKGKKRKSEKREVGRPDKRVVESIPDTPENVAKALFGIKRDGKKVKARKRLIFSGLMYYCI